ncbi:hypothetical protein RB195_025567 [Necator americanus]
MIRKWVTLKIIITILVTAVTDAVHVTGKWNTGSERVKIVTKFGFQQTSVLDRKNTRGFVYGNVTSSASVNSTRQFLFALVPQTLIASFHSDSKYAVSCGVMMQNISRLGFESRCFTDGKRGDIFRWIPCAKGQLCHEEDDPRVVVPGWQMTMQVEEPSTAEYWYIVFLACKLDKECRWVHSDASVLVDYNIWLTNGRPSSSGASPLTWQFSFDEQDTLEIYIVTLVVYIVLSAIMSRGLQLSKTSSPPGRLRMLNFIITMKAAGVALQSLNVFVFALDGEGLFIARVVGEILRVAGIELLWLLLLLLSRGWGLYPWTSVSSRTCIIIWAVLATTHFILFICNFIFLYDVLHEVDVFSSWPGYGQLLIRILLALWFLVEIRKLIMRERSEERATFIAHIGSGFLVWFVYLPGLGVIASFISQLWRFKIILGITTFANYVALACLVHLFWPTSSYRKFFHDGLYMHRRMERTESHEMHDLERLLLETDDSDADFPEVDSSTSLHVI